MNDDVTQYIDNTAPWQIDICEKLRAMVHETLPHGRRTTAVQQAALPQERPVGGCDQRAPGARSPSAMSCSTPRTYPGQGHHPGFWAKAERQEQVDIEEGQNVDYAHRRQPGRPHGGSMRPRVRWW